MNIFYLSSDPVAAAQMMVDSHVVKMPLETAQLLSTAHRVLDGEMKIVEKCVSGSLPFKFRKSKQWIINDQRENILYKATHINHPSAIWCRESNNNYNWLYCHFVGLLNEYTYRYGKTHKCSELLAVLKNPPISISIGPFTPPTPAMDKQYIVENDSIASYKKYYKEAKTHLHKWKNRDIPDWIKGA